MTWITTLEQLEPLFGPSPEAALVKVTRRLTPAYARWIERSRFCILSSVGPEGTDGTPRGDDGPVVRIADPGTLLMPDWHGNNRIDTLRNIVRDGRVSLAFLVPGSNTVVRVNGTARLSTDPALCESFTQQGRHPRVVVVIAVAEVYFQCARALIRAAIWTRDDSEGLPTPGEILSEITERAINGADYDREWPARAATTLW